MKVFAVVQHGGGAHEPLAVFSLWTHWADADAECKRLTATQPGSRGFEFAIFETQLNVPADDMFN